MNRREEISMSGYYHDLVERGFSVHHGWSKDLEQQGVARPSQGELVYDLGRAALLAGVIRFTPLERVNNAKYGGYLFDERLEGEFARDRSLALRFGQAALLDFEIWQAYDDDLGLKSDRDDTDSLKTYEELGFRRIGSLRSTDERVTMLRPGIVSRRSGIARGEAETL